MTVRMNDGSFSQDTPASNWSFALPVGRKFPHVIGAFSNDGMTEYQIDGVEISNGQINIAFGIDQFAGVLKYSYESESGTTVIDGGSGVVNITINQSGVHQSQ